MRFWDKSLQIFNCLCDNGTQSVRRIAQQTGLSKSSVHRLTQAMERRGQPSGVLVVGNRRRPAVVDAPGGRHALYVRSQARCGAGHDERVFRSSAP